MATKMVIEWVHEGFEGILCDPGVLSTIQSATETIQARANSNNRRKGKGFGSVTKIAKAFGSKRAMGLVYSTDAKSAKAEAEDKALSRAVSG